MERKIQEKKIHFKTYFFFESHIIFRIVEIFKNYFFQIKKIIVNSNSEYLPIFHLLKWKFPKLINYLFDRHVLKWPRYYGMVHPCAWHDVNGWVMNILGCRGPLVSIRGVKYFIFSWTCEHVCMWLLIKHSSINIDVMKGHIISSMVYQPLGR
jgi:hypothetical protein